MATTVILPKQGLMMSEGTLLKWFVEEGGKVEEGKPLFEMETDKTSMPIDANVSGTLLKIVRQVGETVPVAEVIAIIGEPGEDISEYTQNCVNAGNPTELVPVADASETEKTTTVAPDYSPAGGRIFISPRARMVAEEKGVDYTKVTGTGPEGIIIERDILAAASPNATSLAKSIAAKEGISLAGVSGSGHEGKVVAADVRPAEAPKAEVKAEAPKAEAKAEAPKSAPAAAEGRGSRVVPISRVRKLISKRMHDSLQNMAQANHRINVDMTECVRIRSQFKAAGIKVSYNDIVIKCIAKALMEHPEMNCCMDEQNMTLHDYVNMGMACDTDRGLLVPVIKDADILTIPQIAAESARVAQAAKTGRIAPADMSGATFTVSNLGMFDIDDFTAIINPPEVGIIAVGKMEDKVVAINGEMVIRPMMQLSLTYDHRVVDGAPAARFLKRVKDLLQAPAILL